MNEAKTWTRLKSAINNINNQQSSIPNLQSEICSSMKLGLFVTTLLLLAPSPCLYAQKNTKDHPNSPVFKDYRKDRPSPLLIQSDVTYRLWQTFLLERQANAGDVLAQHELGIRYLTGKGVSADTAKGAHWIQRAAAQNLAPAQFNLGLLFYHGWGVEWNPFSAYKYFLTAAKRGLVEAEYVMGQFLTDNLVVPRNWNEAYRWVKLAADSGYAPAKETLKELDKRMAQLNADSSAMRGGKDRPDSLGGSVVFLDFGSDSTSHGEMNLLKDVLESGGEELRKALGLATMLEGTLEIDSMEVEAIRRTAEEGSPEALAVLGRCYEKGILMKTDVVQAAEMYVRAIRLDSPRAGELLWKLLQDDSFHLQLKTRSAAGDVHAQYVWPTLRALGFDGTLHLKQSWIADEQAFKLLERSAVKNHLPALVELGLCYFGGRWVAADRRLAMQLWNKAARLGSSEAQVRIAVTQVREGGEKATVMNSIQVLDDATRAGSVLAQVALGYCYERGVGLPLKKSEAARLYRSASQRGSQDAYRALQRLHDELRPPGKEYEVSEQ